MENYLLSFVTDEEGSNLSIHCDLEGVSLLIEHLELLKKDLENNDCPHTHLFTEDWGGNGLTNTKLENQPNEINQVHHVKIYGWNDQWKVKHKLTKP